MSKKEKKCDECVHYKLLRTSRERRGKIGLVKWKLHMPRWQPCYRKTVRPV